MSAATAVPLANGFLSSATSTQFNEVEEYEKILKLRDEVFAGTHPRLTVPAHATRKVSPPSTSHLSSASHTNVPPPFSSIQQSSQLPGLSLNNSHESVPNSQPQNQVSNVVNTQPEPVSSGYDPVLLVKSDELVKAETRMYRERLEKALKDQFEQKRLDARKRPAPGEAKPDFDIATLLAKALEIAKPEHMTTVVSPRDDASNSQYDENSLYSSRGPDSTPEAGQLDDDDSSSHNQQSFAEALDANGAAEVPVRSLQHVLPAVLPHQTGSKPIHGQQHPIASKNLPSTTARNNAQTFDLTTLDNEDDDEEGEYSPPEAMDQVATLQGSGGQALDPRSRPLRRYSELEENGRRPDEGNMRIVRNHITSPVAPQPSRVSPLAVAKDSVILQNPRGRTDRTQRGRDESPDNGQQLHPKKKRKLDRKAEKRRRFGKGSPDIKDEPVSPPPFHNVQPLGSGKSRTATDDRPILLDDVADSDIRYIRSSDRYIDTPTRPLSRYAEPMMPLSEPRVISRTSMRPMADNTDLRRIASLHNMRAEPSRDYVEQVFESPTRTRATSYIQVDSPIRMEGARQYQDVPVAYEREAPQGLRVARSPAPAYHEVYQENRPEVRYVSEAMPPPPPIERIIVDKYGRRFREIIQQDRPSIAPRATPAYVEREEPVYYDTFDRPRAGSVMVETGPDQRYVQEMPPPTRLARPTVDPNSARLGMYEPISSGRSTSVVPTGTPIHQPIFNDARTEYREPIRMSSVRPAPSRYEEQSPIQVVGRAPSVRPQGRETSYLVEDRSQARREYVTMEPTPQYRMMDQQQPRYFDAQGREVVMEVPQDGGQKYVQRY